MSQLPFNIDITDPDLRDLLDLHTREVMLSLNCHAIATVTSFDSGSPSKAPRITATMNYKKTFKQFNSETNVYDSVLEDYPLLLDMPVVVMSGGNASLTFPIAKGDECLVLFNDRSLDNWFHSGQIGELSITRLHSFSDGIALVGLRSNLRPLSKYYSDKAALQNGDTKVGVGASKVLISNTPDDSTTLNTLLQNLITQLTSLTTALSTLTVTGVTSGGASSGVPSNAAVITAIGTQLSTIATQIGGLLQ